MNAGSEDASSRAEPELERVFSAGARRPWHRRLLWWGLAALVPALVLGALLWSPGQDPAPRYVTAEARRGDLTVTVTATGTLQPVNQVEVGTEVSGTIETVEVDYNDRVRVGQVLARLDTDKLQAQERQSEAALALARAGVREAEATLVETRNKLARIKELSAKGLASQEDRDAAEAAHARAQAALAVARAKVVQAEAQLDADRTALEKAVIRSPIDGIVLKRQVEPGQTVAASLQTPVLFTLAENLAQMELNAAVDEVDVGQVAAGQQASFSVDAYPERRFPATVTQVRYAPEEVDGVVTYGTVLAVDNSELLLRPGMTATVDIVVARREDALLVPNAALRFSPPRRASGGSGSRSLFSRLFPRPPARQPRQPDEAEERTRVWVLDGGQARPVHVKAGASDGQMTEILAGELAAGAKVIVDVAAGGA